jgi:hypothetical protein
MYHSAVSDLGRPSMLMLGLALRPTPRTLSRPLQCPQPCHSCTRIHAAKLSLWHIRLHHDALPPLLLPLNAHRPCFSCNRPGCPSAQGGTALRDEVAAASQPITKPAFLRLHDAPEGRDGRTPGESFIGLRRCEANMAAYSQHERAAT